MQTIPRQALAASRLIPLAARTRPWPIEQRWGTGQEPLPIVAVYNKRHDPDAPTVNLTTLLTRVIEDITAHCEDFHHLRLPEMLVTLTPARTRRQHGLLARVTPMRFQHGTATRRSRGVLYQVQRYMVDGREMLYLVTFCVPRFLEQTFEQKLVTIFHELYHIHPNFDGDIRRLPGRCVVHSRSKKAYDAEMLRMVKGYLEDHPNPEKLAFLHRTNTELKKAPLNLYGVCVPQPKMIPIGVIETRSGL
ncbi:MAG: putative metallopeptidase [Fimbriiglobus sp.]